MRYVSTLLLVVLLAFTLAQSGTVRGVITDKETSQPMIGANITLSESNIGTTTDEDGLFILTDVPTGEYTFNVDYVGYDAYSKLIDVGEKTLTLNIKLNPTVYLGREVTVLADRAKPRETPVAFSDVSKPEIVSRLGSRDIPLILNTTPSVYSTASGGGPGDARINIRGFDQRNFAVMINGVPVNDMENGWVYWSNWDGLGDATSSIQVQRGLSAANLAVPSVGGTMNILTDPAAINSGLIVKTETGNDNFQKQTIVANTGLVNNKFAFSGAVVRKLGDGVVQGTWADAWAYYVGLSYIVNKNHKLDFYAIGAPQQHGQNLYMRSIASYSTKFALDQGIPVADVAKVTPYGREYNETWGYTSYNFLEYWNDEVHNPHENGVIYDRVNYYHKPQINLNWFWRITDQLDLNSVLYYSNGKGGGSGRFGSGYIMTSGGHVNWDAVVARNTADDRYDETFGGYGATTVIRNSVNNHDWYGAISKANYRLSPELNISAGIDLRTFTGHHWREVRNLLGSDFIYNTDDANSLNDYKKLGDKIAYNFDNKVTWYGGYGEAEYKMDKFSAYGTVGGAISKYKHTNFFLPKLAGSYQSLESDNLQGLFLKGGLNYLLDAQINVFVNAGYLSKTPIFDNVIDDGTFTLNKDPKNEKIMTIEAGSGYKALDGRLALDANLYYTQWNDRGVSLSYRSTAGVDYYYNLIGMDERHMGLEVTADLRPLQLFTLNGMFSYGNWKLLDNVTSTFRPQDNLSEVKTVKLYIKDLYTSDAPQVTGSLVGWLYPLKGTGVGLTMQYASRYFASFDPIGRTNPEIVQSWETPAYTLFDFHINYKVPVNLPVTLELNGHIFNLFDTDYISDAQDGKAHDAATANVYFGLPRTWVAGMTVTM